MVRVCLVDMVGGDEEMRKRGDDLLFNLRYSEAVIYFPFTRQNFPQSSQSGYGTVRKDIFWRVCFGFKVRSLRPLVALWLQRVIIRSEHLACLVDVIITDVPLGVLDLLRIHCVLVDTKPCKTLI